MFLKKRFLLLIALMSVFSSWGQSNSYTLEQALSYAIEHNYQVKNAKYETELAKQDVNTTKAMGLPQISGEGSFQNFIDIPTQLAPADAFAFPDYLTSFLAGVAQQTGVPLNVPAPTGETEFSEFQFGTKYNFSGGVTVNQIIFDGSYFYGLRAAKAYSQLMKVSEQKTEETLRESVEQAYYMALIAEENHEILSKSKSSLENLLKQTKAFNEEGFLEEQDVEQLDLNLTVLENSIKNAGLQKDLALKMLKFQMGYPINDPIELADDIEKLYTSVPKDLASKESNVQNLSDYSLIDYQEKLLTINKKVTQSSLFPKLYAFFNHSQNAFMNEIDFSTSNWYPTTLWGLKLQVPIFSGFKYKAEMKKANVEMERVADLKHMTEEHLKLQVESAKTEYIAAFNDFSASQKSMNLAQKIEKKTMVKFNEGLASSMELTQAQNQYLSNQGNYINALLRLMNAKTSLEKVLK